MSTHQFNKNMLPDNEFVNGDLKYLVVSNECRLMDVRRTPGFIKSIDMDGGYFLWEISDFEDKGKHWSVTFEDVKRYQFKKEADELENKDIEVIKKRISDLDQNLEIRKDIEIFKKTNQEINFLKNNTSNWLKKNSVFFKSNPKFDFQCTTGPKELREDFNKYMQVQNLFELEKKTSELQVLNPHSGDWVRGMQIVMAEMGIKEYFGKNVRSSNTFKDEGTKAHRRAYIIHRLAYIRSVFDLLGINEVTLYRGMTTESQWQTDSIKSYRFWSSWTFNFSVANDFADLKPNTKYKNAYLIKRTIPVEKLFMTFLETDAMNSQYLEAEALVLHSNEDKSLW